MSPKYEAALCRHLQDALNEKLAPLLGWIVDDAVARFPQAEPIDLVRTLREALATAPASAIESSVAARSISAIAARPAASRPRVAHVVRLSRSEIRRTK